MAPSHTYPNVIRSKSVRRGSMPTIRGGNATGGVAGAGGEESRRVEDLGRGEEATRGGAEIRRGGMGARRAG